MKLLCRKAFFSMMVGFTLIISLLPTMTVQAQAVDRYDPNLQVPIILPEKTRFSDLESNSNNAHGGSKPENRSTLMGDCSVNLAADFELAVFDLINQERQKAGVSELSLKDNLSTAAREHSADMSCNNTFSHEGRNGKTPFDRIKANGYLFSAAGENIYAGEGSFFTPQAALDAWMGSPSHHSTMLRDTYSEVGIGIIFNPDSKYNGYFTVDFASPAP
jgi:uncharacterized protein YkwD